MYKVNDFWRMRKQQLACQLTDVTVCKQDSSHRFWEGGGFGRGLRDATDWMTCSIDEKSKQLILGS